MELCTGCNITHLHSSSVNRHGHLAGNAVRRISVPFNGHLAGNAVRRILVPLQRNVASLGLQSRTLHCSRQFPGETASEETSTGVNEFGVDQRDGTVFEVEKNNLTGEAHADSSEDEQSQVLDFVNDFKLDSDNTYSILLYGVGAIVALYLTSAIVGSLESIPLLPKLMEVVGLGYTLWFTTRYLLFKRNREELKTKITEIKKQVLGSDIE